MNRTQLTPVVESLFSGFPTIGLEELNTTAALQTRVDRKYLVPASAFAELIQEIPEQAHILEEAGTRTFSYDSVYFDTPARDSYLRAAYGRRRRYKIRTRSYLDTDTSFLEVKTEGQRSATVKERIPYLLADRSVITPDGAAYVSETLAGIAGEAELEHLAPVLETTYGRITLLLPESQSRATIDIGVNWKIPSGQSLTIGQTLVVETKSGSSPGQLDKHLWRHGFRPSRISKFATGLAALIPELPANRWHQTLTKNFLTLASTTPPNAPTVQLRSAS